MENESKSLSSVSIPGFLTKTYEIFSNSEYKYCCEWGQNGKTIVVTKIEEFSKQVLPKYFKHSNFQSFVRQLNMYDFRKLVQDPNNGEFAHQHFLRDFPEKLSLIKRKANAKLFPDPKKMDLINDDFLEMKFGIKGQDFAQEADVVLNELSHQKQIRDNFEKRLKESEEKLNRMSEIEARQSYLEGENLFLKRMIIESRNKQNLMQEKMERVLTLMYSAYVSSGGAIGTLSRQNSIENGIKGLLAIQDGSSEKNNTELNGSEFNLESGSLYSFDYNLARLNSLKSSEFEDDFNLLRSNSLSANPLDDTMEYSQPVKELQTQNISSSSAAYQGMALCRLHSFDNPSINSDQSISHKRTTYLDDNENLEKRPKFQDQNELDNLQKNQDLTFTRIDSLESTISDLLDFIDEFEPEIQ